MYYSPEKWDFRNLDLIYSLSPLANAKHEVIEATSLYIFRDVACAERLTEELQVSTQVSFGRIKESRFGKEGGPFGLKEYLVDKCLSVNYS